MKQKLVDVKLHWRDILVVATALLVFGSLVLVAYGIHQNNALSVKSNNHIDCIIRDLSTPQKAGTSHKYIDPRSALTRDCHIKFTQ
jgi:hypothetical protein